MVSGTGPQPKTLRGWFVDPLSWVIIHVSFFLRMGSEGVGWWELPGSIGHKTRLCVEDLAFRVETLRGLQGRRRTKLCEKPWLGTRLYTSR